MVAEFCEKTQFFWNPKDKSIILNMDLPCVNHPWGPQSTKFSFSRKIILRSNPGKYGYYIKCKQGMAAASAAYTIRQNIMMSFIFYPARFFQKFD